MDVSRRSRLRATLELLVDDFKSCVSDDFNSAVEYGKKAANFAYMKALPVALAVAVPFVSMGCPQQKSKDRNTRAGSSAPQVNYEILVLDEAGNPVPNAELSFYDSSIYNINDGTGTLETLQPKASGYYTTNSEGKIRFILADGGYHIVIKSEGNCTEREFNIQVPGPKPNSPNRTFSVVQGTDGNFNADGHIKYQENYPDNNNNPGGNPPNRYTAGDKLKFVINGVNNSDLEAIVSFCVLDETTTGNPNAAPRVYTGNISNPSESSTTLPGQKTHKVFEWTIPADLNDNPGKYAVYVTWAGYDKNSDGTPDPWHKVGNFFVIPDTTLPIVNGVNSVETFTDQAVDIGYATADPAESGTVRAAQLDISSVGSTDEVKVDKDITVDTPYDPNIPGSGDGNPANDSDLTWASSKGSLPAYGEVLAPAGDIGKNAKQYTIRIFKDDISGNRGYKDVTVKVNLTKSEADGLADKIYDNPDGIYGTWWSGVGQSGGDYWTDFLKTTGATATPFDVLCNKFNNSYSVGHNYNRQGTPALTDEQKLMLEEVINSNNSNAGPEFIKVIERSIKTDFVTTLKNYLQLLKDNGKLP